VQDFESRVGVFRLNLPLGREEVEQMKLDPVAMYLHSLRTFSRLPEELHESMLVHSLDPAKSENVRSYLEWVSACEERDERMASARRREVMLDRMILGSMVVGMLGYVLLLFMVAAK
jgi:hypothetical protein